MKPAGSTRNVQIVLDPACGWSFLTYTRFERAAARYRALGGEVAVTFRPFQLDPDAVNDGEPLLDVLRRKFGENAARNTVDFAALAAKDGLEVNYDRAVHSNTFEAHRLIATAARQGLAERMVDRLFRAHYTDGLDIGAADTLAKLAAEIGVKQGESEAGADEVRAELDSVRKSGVRGVPVFRFEGGPEFSGAQQEDALFAALEQGAGHGAP